MMHHDSPTRAPRTTRPVETSHAARHVRPAILNSRAVRLCASIIFLFTGVTAMTTAAHGSPGQRQARRVAPRATPDPAGDDTPASNANGSPASATQPDNSGDNADPGAPTPTPGQPAADSPAAVQPSTPNRDIRPRVVEVYKLSEEVKAADDKRSQQEWERARKEAGLNDIIILRVANLRALLDRAQCIGADAATCRKQEIVLYIDGREIKGLVPESGAPTIEETKAEPGKLRYHLQRSDESDEHWADLLGFSLSRNEFNLYRNVEMSVGLPGEFPIESDVKDFRLLRVRLYRLIFWLVLFLILGFYLWRLAKESDLLRDRKPVLWKQRKSYSLSQTQAAWWFVLVIISFVFIWLVTGQYDLSASVLVLLGIGFGTALGATVIGQNKSETPTNDQNDSGELGALLLAKSTLETDLSNLELDKKKAVGAAKLALEKEFDDRKQAYDTLVAEIRRKFPDALGWGNINLHTDLLSDAHGVNFHRFQMAVWTIVLGFIFIHSVLSRLSMPQFNTTLLTLMGISSGAYLVGKSSEPQQVTGAAVTGSGDPGASDANATDASAANAAAASTATNANASDAAADGSGGANTNTTVADADTAAGDTDTGDAETAVDDTAAGDTDDGSITSPPAE
jgi:hypothetical protein